MSNSDKLHDANLDGALFALSLDPSSASPLQAQLLEGLRGIVLADPGRAGARLPASRALAAELSVSRTTVQAAYDQMVAEGYLVARRGSGTFIAEDLPHLAPPRPATAPDRHEPQPWLPFQIGLPDQSLLPHRAWARHLERAWRAPEPGLLARADPLGWYPLRRAIADHLVAWRHLPCEPQQVVITSGARESFEIVFRGVADAGRPVAVEDPCWPRIHDILTATGTPLHALRIDEQGFDAARIPPGTGAAIVTPSRHYPTGLNLPLPRRMALLDWARHSGGLVIEDDYDSEFRYRGQPLPALAGLDGLRHTIYLGSFSKLIGPALRIGYMVVPKHWVDKTRAWLAGAGNRASLIPQPALAAFLQSGDFAVHLRRMRRIYARRQKHLIGALQPVTDLLEITDDPSGMHLFTPLKPPLARKLSDRQIARAARRAGLRVGALSDHCILPDPSQGLLLGYAAFDEPELTRSAARLVGLLRENL